MDNFDNRPVPHRNPSGGINKALMLFAKGSVSANVILDHLAYQDYLNLRQRQALEARVGKSFADNRNALYGATNG